MTHAPETNISALRQTAIDALIAEGRVADVMQRLGKAYAITGKVVEGNKIGRTLGYPTANLDPMPANIVLPGQGVYAALVAFERRWYEAMVNVGIRPTLNLTQVTIEAHLFGFNQNIYGKPITIHFLEKIREEMRFSSLAALKSQLDNDKISVKAALTLLAQITKAGDQATEVTKSS